MIKYVHDSIGENGLVKEKLFYPSPKQLTHTYKYELIVFGLG